MMKSVRRVRGARLPSWVAGGLKAGIVVSVSIPIAVVIVAIFPDLKFGYPLVLLPLLLAGPLASRGHRLAPATAAVLVAGLLSAFIAAASLAFGSQGLGTSVWGLTGAASAP